MSINQAILGLLSREPLSGYDLKKLMVDSPVMPWSGNNNQIYKALVDLLERGLVTNEVHHQSGSPSKKIYTLTLSGLAELKNWVLTGTEPPEFKKLLLVQLTFSEQLSGEELDALLSNYEKEILLQLQYHEEKQRRSVQPRNRRDQLIGERVHDNVMAFYQYELEWSKSLRAQLAKLSQEEENQ